MVLSPNKFGHGYLKPQVTNMPNIPRITRARSATTCRRYRYRETISFPIYPSADTGNGHLVSSPKYTPTPSSVNLRRAKSVSLSVSTAPTSPNSPPTDIIYKLQKMRATSPAPAIEDKLQSHSRKRKLRSRKLPTKPVMILSLYDYIFSFCLIHIYPK